MSLICRKRRRTKWPLFSGKSQQSHVRGEITIIISSLEIATMSHSGRECAILHWSPADLTTLNRIPPEENSMAWVSSAKINQHTWKNESQCSHHDNSTRQEDRQWGTKWPFRAYSRLNRGARCTVLIAGRPTSNRIPENSMGVLYSGMCCTALIAGRHTLNMVIILRSGMCCTTLIAGGLTLNRIPENSIGIECQKESTHVKERVIMQSSWLFYEARNHVVAYENGRSMLTT